VRLSETAYAKINLALHVRHRRADGYHEIETLFAFAEDGDMLHVETSEGLSLEIIGAFASGLSNGEDNLVLRAARALQAAFGIESGASIRLEKKLPIAGGIGGGSADAAAAIRLLAQLWNVSSNAPQIIHIARNLGADVPACVASVTVRGEGVGEILRDVPAKDLTGLPLLLVNPGVACPTGPVFAHWDQKDRGPLAEEISLSALVKARNDLEPPAIALVPEIEALLHKLSIQPGIILARMSGSGATCFGLFESEDARDTAAVALSPFWTLATRLR
jgi:4-diphosphocytidyl-2-C-methyl-D-erythritol kinase